MCGICGIVDWGGALEGDLRAIKRMVWMLRHRGPDELGLYADEHAHLGHARLSIVDLAGGAQPMANEDDSLWIVFNGEIYNHVELRPDLERRGHRFKTRCDTEILLHLYEEYGADCTKHLNGQFAFVIWDRVNRCVFMARDRFGICPLYYADLGGRLVFASEIKGILAGPGIEARLDPIALEQVFTFWCPLPPRTAFEGIAQVAPGYFLTATADGVKTEAYWTPVFPPEDGHVERPEAEYAEGLRAKLVRATRLRMRADVPVGAYLSGGLDSSITSAIVKEYTDAALNTFSIQFEDPRFDEREQQETMCQSLGTAHDSIRVDASAIAEAFEEVIWHTETPILRTAPVPLHHLSGLVRGSGVKVVVTGEGADEVLGGYNIFKEAKIRRFWAHQPDSPYRPLLLSRIYPYVHRAAAGGGDAYWQRFFANGLTATDDPCYSHQLRWQNTSFLKRFFAPEVREHIGTYDAIQAFREMLPEGFSSWAPLSQAQHIEIRTFMSGYLLCSQGNRVSMSHSVEVRLPFLDHHLFDYAAAIPPRFKLRALQEKHVLREAARDLIPDDVRRRPKHPYRAPDAAAFLGGAMPDYVRDALSEESLASAGCFVSRSVNRLVGKCLRTLESGISARDDMAVIGILSTQLLYKKFVQEFPREVDICEDRFRLRTPNAAT